MWRKAVAAGLIFGAGFLPSGPWGVGAVPRALAQAASEVEQAKTEFDEGSRQYRAEQWERAASHFEAADELAPAARALRMAIRARTRAGQTARAATLAALAQRRYPGDEATADLAATTISEAGPAVHEVTLACAAPCVVALGGGDAAPRSVPGGRQRMWTLYLEPGPVTLRVGFEDRPDVDQTVQAEAGGKSDLDVAVPARAPEAVAPKTAEPEPSSMPFSPADPSPGRRPAGGETATGGDTVVEGGGISPWWFAAGALVTAGLGGTLVWSGIDTVNNPGTEAVERDCVGLGTDCPAYQDGRAAQTRTNVLIGATAGAGALTVLLAIVADWGGGDEAGDEATEAAENREMRLTPAVGLGDGSGFAGLSLQGRF
ncbi:MAG: hypothetical protein AAF928_20170 [Myxococcota bacterium]